MPAIPELERLSFRILEEYDEAQGTWTAICLETGAVASATEQPQLQQLILDTIQLELLLAVRKGAFSNLFRKPASGEVWAKWFKAAGMSNELSQTTIELDLGNLAPRRGVQIERQTVTRESATKTA